jgi:hypothetical protein
VIFCVGLSRFSTVAQGQEAQPVSQFFEAGAVRLLTLRRTLQSQMLSNADERQ